MLYSKNTSSKTNSNPSKKELEEFAPVDKNPITRHVLYLQLQISGLTFGLFFATVLFLSTTWLLVLGGENVGTNLSLLRYYLPGYSVTWIGSILGALYGLFYGYIFGFSVAYVYNRLANFWLKKDRQK